MRVLLGTMVLAGAAALVPADISWAASLQVAPVLVEVAAPGAASTLKLRNEGAAPINVQIRVFRWSQSNGQEKLEPTSDVVASPPLAKLSPKGDYTVRLVRVSKTAVAKEESYRLLVDELPEGAKQNRSINLVLRYSIPVFFYPSDGVPPKLAWKVEQSGKGLSASVTNTGDRHVRISALRLHDANGSMVSFGNGLTGYVLGRSTMHWTAPAGSKHLNTGQTIMVSAQGDIGAINDHAAPK